MNSKAIEELRKLVKIEGITRKDGAVARQEALERWLISWIEEVSISQSIIKKHLTSQDQAAIGDFVTEKLIENLMENCITLEQTPNKIEIKALALRK